MKRSGPIVLGVCLAARLAQTDGTACEDRDRDGFATTLACSQELDCNDDDRYSFPGAPEICDGVDNDCNGRIDDHPSCPVNCLNPEVIPPLRNISQRTTRALEPKITWARDAWIAGFDSTSATLGAGCSDLWITKLARDGTTLIPPTLIAGATQSDFASPEQVALVWTGRFIGATWKHGLQTSCNGISDSDIRFRQFDSTLQPVSAMVSFHGCPASTMVGEASLAWGRSSFLVGWDEAQLASRVSSVTRDSVAASECGIPFTDARGPLSGQFLWNGQQFGAAWTEGPPDVNWTTIFGELYFRRISEDGVPLDPEPTRVTFNPARTERSTLTWADGEWASAWSDTRTNNFSIDEIYMTRMTPEGTAINPPGDIRVTCCNSDGMGTPRSTNRLVWTGGEFGVTYEDLNNIPEKLQGDIYLQRVDRNGSLIGAPLLVSNDIQKHASFPDAAWNGREYGIVWNDYRGADPAVQVYFGRVGCNCTDSDADGFSSCAGRDCVDSNPLVNPLRPEGCTTGFDDNCDGKIDCQDQTLCATGPGATPAEVQGVRFEANKSNLRWNADTVATSYDVLTGDLTYLLQDQNFSTATCAAWRHPSTSLTVATTPSRGRALYFLVRGKADTCRLGTWGTVLRDAARLTCP